MINTEKNIYIIERGDSIREFDCYVLSIDGKNGGGFTTVFPISPAEYRESARQYGRILPDKVTIEYNGETTRFIIVDDWGTNYEVIIDNSHYTAIEHAKAKAQEYGLLE